MFGRTFAISGSTRLDNVHAEACKYWGVTRSEFSLFYEEGTNVEVVDQSEMILKVSNILDRF